MKQWKLATLEKKSAVEMTAYTKDGVDGYLRCTCQWRWGSVLINSEDRPKINLANAKGLDVYEQNLEVEPNDLSDGAEEWDASELEEEDQAWFEDIKQQAEESGDAIYELVENAGWYVDEHEVHFSGKLELEEV